MTETAFYTRLENRGLLQISGAEAAVFLQGLVTNDVRRLSVEKQEASQAESLNGKEKCIYACLLTPQGKFLYDFFITLVDGVYLLDCEGGERARDLAARLSMYRLRSAVEVEVVEKHAVYAVFGVDIGVVDPRHVDMGRRSFEVPDGVEEAPFAQWDQRRISLCIPDGSRDLLVGKSTMDEGRMDTLNAVDYDKGCYIGQELTARMHYRGLGKKHLAVVDVNALPEGAELRSTCGDAGIALVRD